MEPPNKRIKFNLPGSSGADASSAGCTNQRYEHHESSTFEGAGLQNHGGLMSIGGDVNIMVNKIASAEEEKEHRGKVLESLSFAQMDIRQWSIKAAHTTTCHWFLKTPEYVQWRTRDPSISTNNFLWIKGKPGTGKSTLMKYLNEQLKPQPQGTHNEQAHVLISFFFNARGSDLERSVSGLYRSLLVQLLKKKSNLEKILDTYRPNQQWTVKILENVLREAVRYHRHTPILCLIDALDECDELQIRDMVRFLNGLACTGEALQICFASRHYPHITIKTGFTIILENQNEHQNDIAIYLDDMLDIGHDHIAQQIRCQLLERASGVFIWVALVVDILNREYDAGGKHNLRERLRDLPSDLHDLFRSILTREDGNESGVILCLQWILFADQALTPKELYFAIISGHEPRSLVDCHSDDISDHDISKYILHKSRGLAECTKTCHPTVQFIHESVRDFLLRDDGMRKIFPHLGTNIEGQCHEALKRSCLAYMKMVISVKPSFLCTCESPFLCTCEFPFLQYAWQGILYHAEKAAINGMNQTSFLSTFPRSEWIRYQNDLRHYSQSPYTSGASLLYILVQAGLIALIRAHHCDESCFDVEDGQHGMPILAAIAEESSVVVDAVLEREATRTPGVSIDSLRSQTRSSSSSRSARDFKFDRRKSPLLQLIEFGDEVASVLFITTRTYNVDAVDELGKTVLSYSAIKKYTEVSKLLIDHGAQISIADKYGWTPLHRISLEGDAEIAKLLIDSGADISIADSQGWTPLHRASCGGYNDVAKLLVDAGAGLSIRDDHGLTPLHRASLEGHTEVAKLLTDNGAHTSIADNYGMTPLHRASLGGYHEVAKLLIDAGADISIADNHGLTPLHQASLEGHTEVAKLLIDGGADILVVDNHGWTPLHRALSRRQKEVAKLLIARGPYRLAVGKRN